MTNLIREKNHPLVPVLGILFTNTRYSRLVGILQAKSRGTPSEIRLAICMLAT